jgi:hypothetical protein
LSQATSGNPGGNSSGDPPVGGFVQELEETLDLLQFRVDGWCVWPVFRLSVGVERLKLKLAAEGGLRLRDAILLALGDLVALARARPARYFASCLSSSLVDRREGRFEDIYFDELLLHTGSAYKLERINTPSFAGRSVAPYALIPRDITSTWVDLGAYALARMRVVPRQVRATAEGLYRALKVRQEFSELAFERILGGVNTFYWQKQFYRLLLCRVRPAFMLSCDGYGEHALMAAARESGVRVVEFQHGICYPGGPQYHWSDYARQHREALPLPHEIFLFGSHWADVINPNGFWDGRLKVTGSLRVDRFRKMRAGWVAGARPGTTVLFSAQGMAGQDVAGFFRQALSNLKDPGLRVIFRLHPIYSGDAAGFEQLAREDARVQVLPATEGAGTLELMSEADLHVSISSACHYEALGLGVPTAVLPFGDYLEIADLWKGGDAVLANTPEQLATLIQSAGAGTFRARDAGTYFAAGALAKMAAALGAEEVSERARECPEGR